MGDLIVQLVTQPSAPSRVPAGDPVVLKIAETHEELQEAFGLVYQAYMRSGLARPNPFEMRVTPWQLLSSTDIFVAQVRDEVICTVSLVRDGGLGLPMESVYGEEVDRLRQRGLQLAEVSCLADRRKGQERSATMLFRVMGMMAQCAEYRGVDELMIAVHPRHALFYQRAMCFTPIGELVSYQSVCGNPAVALSLNLKRAPVDYPREYRRFFGDRFSTRDFQPRPIPDESLPYFQLVSQACADLHDEDSARGASLDVLCV
jgi:hypothetical protein